MHTIKIRINAQKDAWNWWHACNKNSHGMDWKQRVDKKHWPYLVGKTQAQAFKYLLPMLKKLYKKHNTVQFAKDLQIQFDQNKDRLFEIMEDLTKHKIYRDDFTCFITTFNRYPYNSEKGYVWVSYKSAIDDQLAIFIHELFHFQFFAYFGEKIWDKVTREEFEYIKEASTILINGPFDELTKDRDSGYTIHQHLRKEMLKEWKKHHNIKKFFDKSVELVKKEKIL